MPQSSPLRESDLIFSSASRTLREALVELKRSNLSIKNRLRSIEQDSKFVCNVADTYQLPLVANERCGSWYIPPHKKVGSVYFKSTDGHFGQWSFSLRRLNLQVFDVIRECGGCVIVDSTRRGKCMPDALSKTIPIWVAVINRLLFLDDYESHELRTPLDMVSESEKVQIESKLDNFVRDVKKLELNLGDLRQKLSGKPMQVTWQRPDMEMSVQASKFQKKNLLVLCTASNQTSNQTSATSDYVQGAADDPESWSLGLDAATFWVYHERLLSSTEDELPLQIKQLVTEAEAQIVTRSPTLIKPTTYIWMGSNATARTLWQDFDVIVSCSNGPYGVLAECMKGRYIHLSCSTGKVGSRQLRVQLPKVEQIRPMYQSNDKILVTCESGKDIAVGVVLALLCLFFDEHGEALPNGGRQPPPINKTMVKQRLSWIMTSIPDSSPSRATLQSVNAFLMGRK